MIGDKSAFATAAAAILPTTSWARAKTACCVTAPDSRRYATGERSVVRPSPDEDGKLAINPIAPLLDGKQVKDRIPIPLAFVAKPQGQLRSADILTAARLSGPG